MRALPNFNTTQAIMRHQPHLTTNLYRHPVSLFYRITSSRSLFVKPSAAFPAKPAHKFFSTTPLPLHQTQQQAPKSQQSQQPQQPPHPQKFSEPTHPNPAPHSSGPSHGPDLGQPSFSFLREASPLVRWTVIVAISVIGTAETYAYGQWGWRKWKEWSKGKVEEGQQREGVGGEGER